jgi:MoaA/NifB/PqqE/SkfB family radical SAM enzyme
MPWEGNTRMRGTLRALAVSASYLFWKHSRPPFYLIHFITERCTANCRHCFIDRNAPVRPGAELSVSEIESIAQKLKHLTFVFITGGEPFLREDISDIAIAYYKYAKVQKIQCPTNGSFPDRAVAFAERVSRACPDLHLSITVSFDAVGERHDESRRYPGLFEQASETFKRLKIVEKSLPNFNANCTTTVSSFNQDHLDELYKYVREDLNCMNYFNTLVRGKPREPDASRVDIQKFERFNDLLEKGLRNEKMRGYQRFPFAEFVNAKNLLSRRLIARVAIEKRYFIPCYAGQIAGVLYSHGEVYPCELLDEPYGNLREWDYDLPRLWRSARANEVRRKIRKTRCFCTHECFTTLNILFNPMFAPRLVLEAMKLKAGRLKPD